MSCDSKFRNDSTYLFFLLLVKELIMLKRCKTTYLRQATKLPNLTRTDVLNLKHENLSRFNRTYEVFKNMRGTSMYYEQSKKNLLAHLRQNGCPTLFFTLSCAEFDWKDLLREIAETVYRRKVSDEELDNLPISKRNKLISENYVQTTLHFQKRVEKLFSLMQYDGFFGDTGSEKYHMSSYFYRVEFQQRGAPHIHSLLWLKDSNGHDAPSFWLEEEQISTEESVEQRINRLEEKKKKIEKVADYLITTSADDITCNVHKEKCNQESTDCKDCRSIREKTKKFQTHSHTFTCAKKTKTMNIGGKEGHGRFSFPKYPMEETKLILGISNELDKDEVLRRSKDLKKITTFLIRQTFSERGVDNSEALEKLNDLSFTEFLYQVGMFNTEKELRACSHEEIEAAKLRYYNALSASIRGTGAVFMKRKVKDLFTNGYNINIMRLHEANHDLQVVIDQYACAQYVCGYLTKNESGMSKLLRAVNEESVNLKQMERLNKLSSVLDKHREVSIQEAVYRLLSLPMTKSSVKVKYLSTMHPHFRDGLLKGNIENLPESESIFHNSPHTYFENRPFESSEPFVIYDPVELLPNYWENLSLTEFWGDYEIVYDKSLKPADDFSTIQTLANGKGFIRKRKERAIVNYNIKGGCT